MRIASLTAFHVQLRLKRPFSHASHTRHLSENLLIRCKLQDGTVGWGEGVPREYVTGESPAGCFEQLATTPLAEELAADCSEWPDVINLCQGFFPGSQHEDARGCGSNALRCAVELSILDAYGRLFGQPVSQVTKCFRPAHAICTSYDEVRYSTAIGAERQRLRWTSLKMRLYGFRQCKVKVGTAGVDDCRRLRLIRRWIGPNVDLRLDANEAWHPENLPDKLAPLLDYRVSCVEQPCPHDQLAALAEARPQLSVPIMLDESLTSMADARRAIELNACDLFNIRLSKCGGFLSCLQLAALANEAGLGYQLGCHPGETGVLSAAGRHWAASVANIRYLEGCYDRHLYRQLLTNEDMTFGYGGRAPALSSPGLGVTVDMDMLDNVTLRKECYSVR